MPVRQLPARPNLDHLKNQARELQRQALTAEPLALARFAAAGVNESTPKLADALHVLAREYGFDTWPALKLHVELVSENPVQALTAAIRANSAVLVRDVLVRHPSLKSHIDEPLPGIGFDTPALLAAVQKDNREMVETLLDAGAHINERSRWWAGSFGVLDSASAGLAGYLIARGATVDIHAAARLGEIDRVRELLAADPQLVHVRGGDGQLPLHFAATVEIAALLLEHGADIDARDVDHESTAAQYMACTCQQMEGHPPYRHDVVRFLLARGAKADLLMASAIGDVSLAESILNDDPETIRITVSERSFPKVDPKSGGSIYTFGFGWTRSPHMIAHQFVHPDVLSLLMQRSPIWLRLLNAAEIGDELYFESILADHPQLFQKLSTAAARRLVGVAVRNNTRAAGQLLGAGWPAAVVIDNGQTPLHYAAWHGNLAMIRDLLAHGAPVNVVETQHGGSPLAWALHGSLKSWERGKGDYPGVAETLLAAGAEITQPEQPLEATEEVLAVMERHLRSCRSSVANQYQSEDARS